MNFTECACTGRSLTRMLRPALLGLLAEEPMHGYVLLQRLCELSMFKDNPPDTGGVYRVLKLMQDEGLVTSSWETGGAGPAKRCYKLSDTGRACLVNWSQTLHSYAQQIEELAQLIDG